MRRGEFCGWDVGGASCASSDSWEGGLNDSESGSESNVPVEIPQDRLQRFWKALPPLPVFFPL